MIAMLKNITVLVAGKELPTGLHIVGRTLATDVDNKTITGVIHSYTSNKVTECFVNGAVAEVKRTPFVVQNADVISPVEEVVSAFLKEKLEVIVGIKA